MKIVKETFQVELKSNNVNHVLEQISLLREELSSKGYKNIELITEEDSYYLVGEKELSIEEELKNGLKSIEDLNKELVQLRTDLITSIRDLKDEINIPSKSSKENYLKISLNLKIKSNIDLMRKVDETIESLKKEKVFSEELSLKYEKIILDILEKMETV